MPRLRMAGLVIAGVGVAILLAFAGAAVQSVVLDSGELQRAQLGRAQNPGNAMYNLQLFIAATRVEFLIAGAVAGGLLALNGVTLMLLGRLAAERQEEDR